MVAIYISIKGMELEHFSAPKQLIPLLASGHLSHHAVFH